MTLREMREAKRLTQCELAASVGVTQAYICALESGRRKNPSVNVIRKIAIVLDVKTVKVLDALDNAV